ncbi:MULTISPECIES: ATP-binding protein [unclassified Beijerinckia]|uniref:sensor histidine kinase n=1 Tax=unclassified Beijerinckia TaxID=2638183 RepID=UPI00089722D1|nr:MULTISPECIES: ATP-binding protein [unclassified Beijerinckia]MDH7794967.1 signal transduction histidine kinase [Beijerinckia sp. GAS462]SEB82257.1 signal transduction histidine kinase [Beijerinckia sp. 28-YEA-48]
MRRNSIVARIVWLHILVVGSVSIFMPVALYFLLASETNEIQRQFITSQVNQIGKYLERGSDGTWQLKLPEGIQDIYSEAYGRYRYAIINDKGQVVFSSLADKSAVFPDAGLTDEPQYLDRRDSGLAVAGARIPETIDGEPFWVEVGEDLSHRDVIIDDILGRFLQRVAWVTLPLLLLLLGLDIAIVRTVFKPVLRASEEAEAIRPSQPGLRLSSAELPSEIRPLVQAINNALDRLESGYKLQHEFAADAAHELRTPLAILRTRIDTLTDRDVSRQLRSDVERMSHTVNQLLEMAESEIFIVGPDEQADLHAIAVDVVSFLAPLIFGEGRSVSVVGADQPVLVNGNVEMIARALRNLVENAAKYSPSGSEIEVIVDSAGALRITDEGAGISDDDKQLLFRRFWRRDRRGTNSVGLGLAIVQRIMAAHSGEIEVHSRSPRGTAFVLRFKPFETDISSDGAIA